MRHWRATAASTISTSRRQTLSPLAVAASPPKLTSRRPSNGGSRVQSGCGRSWSGSRRHLRAPRMGRHWTRSATSPVSGSRPTSKPIAGLWWKRSGTASAMSLWRSKISPELLSGNPLPGLALRCGCARARPRGHRPLLRGSGVQPPRTGLERGRRWPRLHAGRPALSRREGCAGCARSADGSRRRAREPAGETGLAGASLAALLSAIRRDGGCDGGRLRASACGPRTTRTHENRRAGGAFVRFPEELSFPTASRRSFVLTALRARRWNDYLTAPRRLPSVNSLITTPGWASECLDT